MKFLPRLNAPATLLAKPIWSFSLLLSAGLVAVSAVEIQFDVKKEGRVSLAVYNKSGQLVRTLLTGKPYATGVHHIEWDGRDRYGAPLPEGEYEWRALASTGLRAEFVTQIGQNPDPVWEKGVANHEPPMAAAVDETGVYRIGTFDEGAHYGVKTDPDGKYLWTTSRKKVDPWCRFGAALAIVGDELYDLIHNGTVYRYNRHSGECLTSANGEGLWNFRYEGGPAVTEGKETERLRSYVERTGMDLSGSSKARVLIASYREKNAVKWFSSDDGRVTAEAKIPSPIAVAADPEGNALVISEGAVYSVSQTGGKAKVVIPAEALNSPYRLCINPENGHIFVAENSTALRAEQPAHQVKLFSKNPASQGGAYKLLASFGVAEGRKDGAYLAKHFQGITDIEADASGGFVITEGRHQPPRRSARFDATGNLLREWYGAQEYGVIANPEPGNPEYVWLHANGDRGGMVRYQVDYAKGNWRVAEIYKENLQRNELWRSGGNAWRIMERGGKLYFTSAGFEAFAILIYDPANQTLRASNLSARAMDGSRWLVPEALRPKDGSKAQAYLWNDGNDDGLAQSDEIQWLKRPQLGGAVIPGDFSLYCGYQSSGFESKPRLTPRRFTSGGTPIYEFDPNETWPSWKEDGVEHRPWDLVRGSDGSWYGCFSDSLRNPVSGHENHGAWYYNSCSGIDRLVKWDANWKPLWSVGRHSPDIDRETGSTAMARGLVGVAHGCVIWGDASDAEIARPTVWTEDGLYVDDLLRVPLDTMPKEIYGESNAHEFPLGHIAIHPRTGETFFYALNSGGGSPVYRISGWGNWQREAGNVSLSWSNGAPQPVQRMGTGLKAEYFDNPDLTDGPVTTRTDQMVYFHWLKERDKLPDGIRQNTFSVRWSGQVEAATTGVHRFTLETMTPWVGEGWGTSGRPNWMRLVVGGQTVMDTKENLAEETTFGLSGNVLLEAGRKYDLVLECSYRGNAVAKLCWETPELDRRAILPGYLYADRGSEEKAQAYRLNGPELAAHFNFEGSERNLFWSHAGGDIFGRLTGRSSVAKGFKGQGIEFDAQGRFKPALLTIDEEIRLPLANYTVAFAFKSASSDAQLLEAKRYSSYNNRWSDHIISLEKGRVRFHLQGDNPILSEAKFNDDQWHQVVTTVGHGGQRLYVDGKLIGNGALSARTKASNRLPVNLGPGGGIASVAMDELKLFTRALSSDEIATLYRDK